MHLLLVPGLAVQAGFWLRATETEISAVRWAVWLGNDFTFNVRLKMQLFLTCCGADLSSDWSSTSRDQQATTTSQEEDEDGEADDVDDDDGEEILRRVLIAGGLRPSSGAAGGLRSTTHRLMEDREFVSSTADAGDLGSVVSSLRDKVCFTISTEQVNNINELTAYRLYFQSHGD